MQAVTMTLAPCPTLALALTLSLLGDKPEAGIISDVKNWLSLCWSWDASPIQKGLSMESPILSNGRS
eukprot:g17970.t1